MIGLVADIECLVIARGQIDKRLPFRELKVDLIAHVPVQPDDLLRIVGDDAHAGVYQAPRGRQFRMDCRSPDSRQQTGA